MAIDTIGVTLKRNQSILLTEILGEISLLGAISSSGYLELQFPFKRMNSTEHLTVLSYSLLPLLRENTEKRFPTGQCKNSCQQRESGMV